MSMRITLQDHHLGLVVALHASGGYAPDVMNDLRKHAHVEYCEMFAVRTAATNAETPAEAESEAPSGELPEDPCPV